MAGLRRPQAPWASQRRSLGAAAHHRRHRACPTSCRCPRLPPAPAPPGAARATEGVPAPGTGHAPGPGPGQPAAASAGRAVPACAPTACRRCLGRLPAAGQPRPQLWQAAPADAAAVARRGRHGVGISSSLPRVHPAAGHEALQHSRNVLLGAVVDAQRAPPSVAPGRRHDGPPPCAPRHHRLPQPAGLALPAPCSPAPCRRCLVQTAKPMELLGTQGELAVVHHHVRRRRIQPCPSAMAAWRAQCFHLNRICKVKSSSKTSKASDQSAAALAQARGGPACCSRAP